MRQSKVSNIKQWVNAVRGWEWLLHRTLQVEESKRVSVTEQRTKAEPDPGANISTEVVIWNPEKLIFCH